MQDYKPLRIAVMICNTQGLVNTQTHTRALRIMCRLRRKSLLTWLNQLITELEPLINIKTVKYSQMIREISIYDGRSHTFNAIISTSSVDTLPSLSSSPYNRQARISIPYSIRCGSCIMCRLQWFPQLYIAFCVLALWVWRLFFLSMFYLFILFFF